MILHAISIGDSIPPEFNAAVHSVFRAAMNLRLGANQLITILAASEADLPQGIRVEAPDDFSFEIFHAGEPATCRDGNLRLASLTIDLRGARRWKCDLPSLQFDPTNPTVSASWGSAWKALNARQIESNADILAENLVRFAESKSPDFDAKTGDPSTGSGQVFALRQSVAERAGDALRGLVEATRQDDLPRADSSVRALIGLGSGLTPSGDDLLVGFIAGLWCSIQNQNERARFVSNLGDAIIRHSSQTNEISRAYLHHAAQGQVSSLLANLAEAICAGWDSDRLLQVAEAAMRVGHTSGMDAVAGLLIGLATWISPKIPLI
jgi:hypothetical protein